MYKLFWEAMSGAMVVELVLEELGVSYKNIAVDMANGEHRSQNYLALNPSGQVPALKLPDGRVIGESAAIILTLGDRHIDQPLIPNATDEDRPHFLRWLIYMAASPYMAFVQFNHPERFSSDPSTHLDLLQNAENRLLSQFDLLDAAIAGKGSFLPSRLSALDLYLFMLLEFYPDQKLLFASRQNLLSVHQAVSSRPSARKIVRRHKPVI